jgi:hypothetical protein
MPKVRKAAESEFERLEQLTQGNLRILEAKWSVILVAEEEDQIVSILAIASGSSPMLVQDLSPPQGLSSLMALVRGKPMVSLNTTPTQIPGRQWSFCDGGTCKEQIVTSLLVAAKDYR